MACRCCCCCCAAPTTNYALAACGLTDIRHTPTLTPSHSPSRNASPVPRALGPFPPLLHRGRLLLVDKSRPPTRFALGLISTVCPASARPGGHVFVCHRNCPAALLLCCSAALLPKPAYRITTHVTPLVPNPPSARTLRPREPLQGSSLLVLHPIYLPACLVHHTPRTTTHTRYLDTSLLTVYLSSICIHTRSHHPIGGGSRICTAGGSSLQKRQDPNKSSTL